jgi:hypothetical protein
LENSLLLTKILSLPEHLKNEVEDFIDFLKTKSSSKKSLTQKPKFGSGKGIMKMQPDFDDPLEDFNDYTK